MHRFRRSGPVRLLLLGVLAWLVACGGASPSVDGAPAAPAADGAPLRLGFSAWPGWFPWQVAEQQGIFAAQGLNVQLTYFESYTDSLNALATGNLDANSQTLNDTIASVAAGAQETIVLVNDNSTGNDQIIAARGISEPADLVGRAVGAEQGTVDHFLLLLGLDEAGLSSDDINFQPLETGAAAAAFASGSLDAVGLFAPFTTTALEREGAAALWTSADFPGAIPDHLVVSDALLTDRPDDIAALVAAWFDTLAFIADEPEQATAIMAERAGVSAEEYATYEAGTTLFSLEDNLRAFGPGEDFTSLAYAAEEISAFLVRTGLVDVQPDLQGLFDDGFVRTYAQEQS